MNAKQLRKLMGRLRKKIAVKIWGPDYEVIRCDIPEGIGDGGVVERFAPGGRVRVVSGLVENEKTGGKK